MKDVKDFELSFDGERCSLLIREVYLEDSGDYKCVAKNAQGTAETSCRLVVERKFLIHHKQRISNNEFASGVSLLADIMTDEK